MTNFEKCPMCGSEKIYWLNDENVFDDIADDDTLRHCYRCADCGCDIDITEPSKHEKQTDYNAYWKTKETAD